MYTRPEVFIIILALWLSQAEADDVRPLPLNSYSNHHHHNRPLSRPKRMYAMCPPKFIKLGSECYYFSTQQANWLEAHFECKDKNSRLAEPQKHEDRLLRKYLMQQDRTREEKWIGGNYNWELKKWVWGYSGNEIKYQSFSRMKPGQAENLKFQCAALNPELKYKWSAKYCTENHYYICQHTMPYVSEYNRERIYQKWNTTFPNELANEIEIVLDGDNQQRSHHKERASYSVDKNELPRRRRPLRRKPKKPRVNEVSTNDVVQPIVAYAEDPLLDGSNSNGHSNGRKPHYPVYHKPPPTTKTTTTTTTTTTTEPTTTTKKATKKPRRHNYRRRPVTPRSTTPTTTTTTTIKPTTPRAPSTTTISPEEVQKLHKKQQLLDRFNRLTPDEQREFLKKKKDRQRQKLAMKKNQNETIP